MKKELCVIVFSFYGLINGSVIYFLKLKYIVIFFIVFEEFGFLVYLIWNNRFVLMVFLFLIVREFVIEKLVIYF